MGIKKKKRKGEEESKKAFWNLEHILRLSSGKHYCLFLSVYLRKIRRRKKKKKEERQKRNPIYGY